MGLNRKLKMGMVGGGPGAFIGEVHRKVARTDVGIEPAAGAFDINPHKSRQTWRKLNIIESVGQNSDDAFIFVISYVGMSFAEILREDSDDVSIFACELLCETGPDFPRSIVDNDIINMLANYSKYLEQKQIPNLLRIFIGNQVNSLSAASQIVKDIDINTSQEEIANDIWRAGEEIMLGRLKAKKLLPRGIRLHEYQEIPKELLGDIEKVLEESRDAMRMFDEKPTMENAVHSCECNRKTMLLLFLIRGKYYKPEITPFFNSFREVVGKCRKGKISVAGMLPDDDPRKEFLGDIIAESEQRRLNILEEMKNQNMQEAIERMWDAIEKEPYAELISAEMYYSLGFMWVKPFLCCLFTQNGYNLVTYLKTINIVGNRFLNNLVNYAHSCSVERDGYET